MPTNRTQPPDRLLGGLTADEFLAHHWQKTPLLVRGAIDPSSAGVTIDDLWQLAGDEDVESRLVERRESTNDWAVRYGPFDDGERQRLADRCWTLLVQEVDRFVFGAADLLDRFRFVPNWRIDDLMVSYAVSGAGVGAHVDDYDVFLVQASGTREWCIEDRPRASDRWIPDLELRILEQFEPDRSWLLEAGDLLYLPPRIPHRGTAVDEGMTCSVGLRAPSHRELAAGFLQHAVETLPPGDRYRDPELVTQSEAGEISRPALERVRQLIEGLIEDDTRFVEWFGRLVTEPRRESSVAAPGPRPATDEIRRRLQDGERLRALCVPAFAYADGPDGGRMLFAGGRSYPLADSIRDAGPLLSGRRRLDDATLGSALDRAEFADLVGVLVAEGLLIFERDQAS